MYTTDWINSKNLVACVELEREMPDPLSEKQLHALLKKREIIGIVCYFDGAVVAHMLYRLHKTSFELLRLVVTKNHRRKRVASMMVSKLLKKLTPYRRGRLVCVVRASALAIQLVFRSLGIKGTKVHFEYFEDTEEDGYEFEFIHPQCLLRENGVEFAKGKVQ